jgi:hypothetical protein
LRIYKVFVLFWDIRKYISNNFCLWKHHVNLLLQSFRSSLLRRGLHEVSSEGKGARKEWWEELNKGSLCELMQSIWRRI